MDRAGSQVLPASRLRANQAGPVDTLGVLNAVIRSHTAYTADASFGSAVMAPLSTATLGSTSTWSPAGSLQVSPRSMERLARMARRAPGPEAAEARPRWFAGPSGEVGKHRALGR